MIDLLFIRHAPTAWNDEGRLQGQSDIPLSAAGRVQAGRWRAPLEFGEATWIASPLSRCIETARLMGAEPDIEPALTEMDWGDWEGRKLPDLRQELGAALTRNEERGLDFRPDGGESPRQVMERLKEWLPTLDYEPSPYVAVTHKGVIRAALALAMDWPMLGKAPSKAPHGTGQWLRLDEDGTLSVIELDMPLTDGGDDL